MLKKFIENAVQGKSVYVHEIRECLAECEETVGCVVSMHNGNVKLYNIGLYCPDAEPEVAMLKDYFYANIYNIITFLGGVKITIYAQGEYGYALAATLAEVFGIGKSKEQRYGYAKCLNVADRINRALGFADFEFEILKKRCEICENTVVEQGAAVGAFVSAVQCAKNKALLGIDIGGTSIKLVGVIDENIACLKEHTWNPANFKTIAQLTGAVENLIEQAVQEMGIDALDGIGISFPDVVIRDKIVGGETHKTQGVRAHSKDYENEFASLTNLDELLKNKFCKPNAPVRITNDGPMAAFTAAVELACSSMSAQVCRGIFAHSIGTELGTGWIDQRGEVPEYPLEGYNCIIDVGSYPAKEFCPEDTRSIKNYNTGIAGTCQKYIGVSGAFRIAEQIYKQDEKLYKELLDKKYIAPKNDGGIQTVTEPIDMRREFMKHLVAQLEQGQPLAAKVFELVGSALAAVYTETEYILSPAAKSRFLFGGCMSSNKYYQAICRGAKKIEPNIELISALDELCHSPLMKKLREHSADKVGQYTQAIGSVYFSMM